MNIRVSVTHDADSEVLDTEEAANLRGEVERLKKEIKSMKKLLKEKEVSVTEEVEEQAEVKETPQK